MAESTGIEKAQGKGGDDKKAVAGGIAITVVVILIVGWAIIFIHNIQTGSQQVNLSSGAQDQFNFTSVKEAQDQLKNSYNNVSQDLKDLRDQAQAGGQQMQMQQVVQDNTAGDTNQFTGTADPTPGQ